MFEFFNKRINIVRYDVYIIIILAPVLGHVGDGNYHVTLLYDEDNEKEKQLIHSLAERIVR